MKLETNRHWSIVGFTGSGKTTFDIALIRTIVIGSNAQLPIYILDSKIQGDFNLFKPIATMHYGNTLPPVKWFTPKKPILIWQPESDDLALYGQWFDRIYQQRTPCVVLIDEISSIGSASGKPPRGYDILLKQGRGLGIGLINNTQSPSFIPPMLMRQSTYFVRFTLNDEYDVDKLAKVMGRAVLTPPPDEHGFWFRDARLPAAYSPPVYFRDYKDFFT